MRRYLLFSLLTLLVSGGRIATAQFPGGDERRDRGDERRDRGDERRDRGSEDRGSFRGGDDRGGFGGSSGFGGFRGGDDRGGFGSSFGGGPGFGSSGYGGYSGYRGGFDSRSWIEGMDANKNGIIEPSELSERSSRFLGRTAEQAGLKMGEPWPVDKLIAASNGGSSSRSDSSRSESSNSSASKSSTLNVPKVAILGFGEKDGGIKIQGFDVPLPSSKTAATANKQYDERTTARVDELLREADTNHNGFLDRDEIQAYRSWATPPEESDLDKDGRLSRAELLERIAKRSSSSSSRSSSSGSNPSSSSPSKEADAGDKARKYAEGIIQKYDANKSGYLEKDEWKDLKSDYHSADTNKDNVISLDELVIKLNALNSGQGSASGSSAPSSSSGSSGRDRGDRDRGERDRERGPGGFGGFGGGPGGPGGFSGGPPGGFAGGPGGFTRGGDRNAKGGDKKPALRALTATEKLPKGLPDWFLRNDADADGQVSMSEYAAAWSDSTVTEFMKYDTNGDGIITANECLAVDSKKR